MIGAAKLFSKSDALFSVELVTESNRRFLTSAREYRLLALNAQVGALHAFRAGITVYLLQLEYRRVNRDEEHFPRWLMRRA